MITRRHVVKAIENPYNLEKIMRDEKTMKLRAAF